MGKQAHIKKS